VLTHCLWIRRCFRVNHPRPLECHYLSFKCTAEDISTPAREGRITRVLNTYAVLEKRSRKLSTCGSKFDEEADSSLPEAMSLRCRIQPLSQVNQSSLRSGNEWITHVLKNLNHTTCLLPTKLDYLFAPHCESNSQAV
jgi:hypothetical protein